MFARNSRVSDLKVSLLDDGDGTDVEMVNIGTIDVESAEADSTNRKGYYHVFVGLLYWAMLAASTVGPGTIIVMAKAGSDHQLELCWCVLVASAVAFVQQEAAARLFIVSGLDLGSAVRFHFNKDGRTPTFSRILALAMLLGNVALESAQFVGLLAALRVAFNPVGTSGAVYGAGVSVAAGLLVSLLLQWGDVDRICKGLGVVVLLMVIVFAIGTAFSPLTAASLFKGVFVPGIPTGAADIALSMIATTALPMNVFLASSLAAGFTIREMRVGIAFSCAVAGLLSVFIVVVGSGISLAPGQVFAVEHLSRHMKESMGTPGEVLFVFGLFAASFSSALTIALGTAVAVQALLSVQASFSAEAEEKAAAAVMAVAESGDAGGAMASDDEQLQQQQQLEARLSLRMSTLQRLEHIKGLWRENGPRFRSVLHVTIWVAVVVAAVRAPTVQVVIVSQVIGGLLLPCVTVSLLLVSCNPRFTHTRRATTCEFVALVVTCAVTLYLAAFVLLPKIAPSLKATAVYAISAVVTVILMVPVLLLARRASRLGY